MVETCFFWVFLEAEGSTKWFELGMWVYSFVGKG